MKEEAKSLTQLHAERKLFVEKAMKEGALVGISRKRADIGLMYVFNDELTLDDIATLYPQNQSGRANVSMHYHEFIRPLYARVSNALGSQYRTKELLARKPLSQKSRERKSESRGGKALEIRDLILRGARSVDELEKQSGLSKERIWAGLRTLERWGIDVSQFSSTIRKNGEKIRQLIEEDDDGKIQKILDDLSSTVIIDNMKEHKERKKRRNPRVLTTIGRATSDVYHYKFAETHLFAQDLEENGIPNRRVEKAVNGRRPLVCYVFLEKHKDRALAAWDKDPRLERFKVSHPVTIVCDENMDIPTATQLYGKNYRSVSSILSDLGIRIHSRQQGEFRKWLFEGCPITIWAYRHGKYIATSDIDQFKQYFLQKHALLEE